jgi:hypothetical protein
MLYGVGVVAAWLAVGLPRAGLRRIRLGHLVVSGLVLGLAVLLLYLPVILISGPDKLAGNRFVVPLDGAELVRELPRSLGQTWAFWNRDLPLPVSAMLVVGFALATLRDLGLGRLLRWLRLDKAGYAAEAGSDASTRNAPPGIRSDGSGRTVPLGLLAAGVCLALVVGQRVAPFERVWLFLLPLYFVIAVGGLPWRVDGRLLAAAVGALLGIATLTSGSVPRSDETGTFADAEAVAQTLRGRLAAEDAVLSTLPASLPELQYYFPRAGLPTSTLVRVPQQAEHLYVVAPGGATPTVDGWTEPREVARLPASSVYVLRRAP